MLFFPPPLLDCNEPSDWLGSRFLLFVVVVVVLNFFFFFFNRLAGSQRRGGGEVGGWGGARRAKLAAKVKLSLRDRGGAAAAGAGGASASPAPRLPSRPSVAPAGVPAMVWHLYGAIFTDLNTNGYCLIVSRFISQTSSARAPAQLLQSKPLSLNRAAYSAAI